MPASILVVEGDTDKAFFAAIFGRMYPSQAGIEILPAQGQYQIPETIRVLLRRGVQHFAVAQDVDRRSPAQVVQAIQGVVFRQLGVPLNAAVPNDNYIQAENRTISVLPIGLIADPVLTTLGVFNHTVEDYLIKLMLLDPNLRQNAPELGSLLAEILPRVRHYDGVFDSGKELFQLIKPIAQHGFSDTAVTRQLVEHADMDILRSVLTTLLPQIEQAFGLPAAP